MSEEIHEAIDVGVIIVGGGGCGLTLSSLLSQFGVDHILFERHAGTSTLPKAHYINQHSMEVFRQHGIAEHIVKRAGNMSRISRVSWVTTLGGDGPFDRKRIASVPTFGSGNNSTQSNRYIRHSPMRFQNIPLVRLEPILRKTAEDRNPGRVLFSHTVTDFLDTDKGVLATIRDCAGQQFKYRAQYMIGADGGKFVGPKIGVQMEGTTGIADVVSVHFEANLSAYWDDRDFACHIINVESEGLLESGSLVPLGPTWGHNSEEWILHCGQLDKDDLKEETFVYQLRELLKIPDLEAKILHINHWVLERVLANKYQEGHIFVAGDAAHRQPPTTGLGLNTAIGDAHNLAWKLACVLHGKSDPSLLESYAEERRPVGKRNCDWGLMTFMNSTVLYAAMGLVPGWTERNRMSVAAMFEESDMGATKRALVKEAIASQKIEFSAQDLEIGFSYSSRALVPDGTPRPRPDPLGQTYHPTTRPGHRLPHTWLHMNNAGDDKAIVSTHDLVSTRGNFLLITDSKGAPWVEAAKLVLPIYGVELNVATIDTQPVHGKDVLYIDSDDNWSQVNQLEAGGAIIVRPDNIVAWRSISPASPRGVREMLDAISIITQKKRRIPLVNDGFNDIRNLARAKLS